MTVTTAFGTSATSSADLFSFTGAPADLFQSTVTVAQVSIAAGSTTTVTLTARNSQGTQETGSELTIGFGLGTGTGSGTFSTVTNNGDGTYSATFTGTTAGDDIITATIDGQALTSLAPTILVTDGPVSLSKSTVTPGSSSVSSGGTTSVTLTAQDGYGNLQVSGRLGLLVPAYIYPVAGGAWDQLAAVASTVPLIAIVNPNSGPGTASDPNYVSAINNVRAAGGGVIGYVPTDYGDPARHRRGQHRRLQVVVQRQWHIHR